MTAITVPSTREIRDTSEGHFYLAYHAPRLHCILSLIATHLTQPNPQVLDVGPSLLTKLVKDMLDTQVDSLGLDGTYVPDTGQHHIFNLNQSGDSAAWPTGLARYDLIIFAEVIEHLYTAPELVLHFLREHLKPGGILLLQTPNAAALPNRLKLLAGRNPFERIRLSSDNPGHFREYTLDELLEDTAKVGFTCETYLRKNYFDYAYRTRKPTFRHAAPTTYSRIVNACYQGITAVLPGSLQRGITLILRA